MRVASLNAWCGGMFESLVAWLPTSGADVLCLQEVTRTPGYRGWVTYADADRISRQRASLFDDVRRVLPNHQAQFFTCDTGPVDCEDGVVRRQQFGIATFVAPHLAVVGGEVAFVHGTVAHFHGVRMASGKNDTPQRRTQAERLTALIGRVRGPEDVVVAAGDMNILPNSESFDILARIELTDLVGQVDTRTSAYLKPVRHASYLLVSEVDVVASFQVVTSPEVSDHRPLALDLT